MALPSIYDLPPRPDHIRGFGEALGGAAKTVESLSPAHPLIAQAMRRIFGGEDPRRVAIETKFAMARQGRPPPNLPDAGAQMEPYPEALARAPRQLRGRMEDVTGTAPGESMGMTGSMRSSMEPPPSSESLGLPPLEETITAPAPASVPTRGGSMPLPSEPSTAGAFYSQGQAPILNRDLPVLMQGAGLVRKDQASDMANQLGWARLEETMRLRNALQPGRDARTEATRATTANIPFSNQMKKDNLAARWTDIGIKQGNLDTRRTENYLKGAGPSLEVTAGLGNLIRQGLANPEIIGNSADYAQRRVAEVAGNLPLFGKFVESALKTGADEDLTFAQREFKRQLTAELSGFIHSRYGSALTGFELEQANKIAGGQLSLADTLAGAQIVYYIANRKRQLYERGYSDVAEKIGEPGVGPNIPMEVPSGFVPDLPNLPEGGR